MQRSITSRFIFWLASHLDRTARRAVYAVQTFYADLRMASLLRQLKVQEVTMHRENGQWIVALPGKGVRSGQNPSRVFLQVYKEDLQYKASGK